MLIRYNLLSDGRLFCWVLDAVLALSIVKSTQVEGVLGRWEYLDDGMVGVQGLRGCS